MPCCVGFCHTTTWISHQDTYIPSPLSFPSTPPSHPSRSSQITGLSSLCYIETVCLTQVSVRCVGGVYVSVLLSQFIPPSPSPAVSTSLFCTSASLFCASASVLCVVFFKNWGQFLFQFLHWISWSGVYVFSGFMFWERDAFGISIIHSWHLLCDMSHNSPLGSILYEHLPEAVGKAISTHILILK